MAKHADVPKGVSAKKKATIFKRLDKFRRTAFIKFGAVNLQNSAEAEASIQREFGITAREAKVIQAQWLLIPKKALSPTLFKKRRAGQDVMPIFRKTARRL